MAISPRACVTLMSLEKDEQVGCQEQVTRAARRRESRRTSLR